MRVEKVVVARAVRRRADTFGKRPQRRQPANQRLPEQKPSPGL